MPSLTLSETQSRFGDKITQISTSLSPKWDCGSEGVLRFVFTNPTEELKNEKRKKLGTDGILQRASVRSIYCRLPLHMVPVSLAGAYPHYEGAGTTGSSRFAYRVQRSRCRLIFSGYTPPTPLIL